MRWWVGRGPRNSPAVGGTSRHVGEADLSCAGTGGYGPVGDSLADFGRFWSAGRWVRRRAVVAFCIILYHRDRCCTDRKRVWGVGFSRSGLPRGAGSGGGGVTRDIVTRVWARGASVEGRGVARLARDFWGERGSWGCGVGKAFYFWGVH